MLDDGEELFFGRRVSLSVCANSTERRFDYATQDRDRRRAIRRREHDAVGRPAGYVLWGRTRLGLSKALRQRQCGRVALPLLKQRTFDVLAERRDGLFEDLDLPIPDGLLAIWNRSSSLARDPGFRLRCQQEGAFRICRGLNGSVALSLEARAFGANGSLLGGYFP